MTAAPAIEWNAAGISRAAADGRYVKRFVGNALTAETYLGANRIGAAQENVLANVSGPVHGGIDPAAWNPALFIEGSGGRFSTRIEVYRDGANGNVLIGRYNGTPSAPLAVGALQDVGQLQGLAWNGSGWNTLAQLAVQARESQTPTAAGSTWRFRANDIGSIAPKSLLDIRGGGTGVAQLASVQNVFTIVPVLSAALRNPSDTANVVEWNATGLGFFGTAPIAKPTVTGAKGGNAALTSLLTQLAALGLITDSTT